ncbi:MAG: hypothetical protein IJW65_00485 [Clostridia bacterium]|nr:hypothetical protein [Clostridia bacterium]
MSGQMADNLNFNGTEYNILMKTDIIPFEPSAYGVEPDGEMCSMCWRGYWCGYDVRNGMLVLDDLNINTPDGVYPPINGVAPLIDAKTGNYVADIGFLKYSGLGIKIEYRGKMVIGRGFLRDFYIHMGVQRGWAFETLIELSFEGGVLVGVVDLSDIAAEIRADIMRDETFSKNRHSLLHEINYKRKSKYKDEYWWF